jgi:hypothetical protein
MMMREMWAKNTTYVNFVRKNSQLAEAVGGAREDRTPDLLNAIQALSHLSYDPETRRAAMGGPHG